VTVLSDKAFAAAKAKNAAAKKVRVSSYQSIRAALFAFIARPLLTATAFCTWNRQRMANSISSCVVDNGFTSAGRFDPYSRLGLDSPLRTSSILLI
jgi:hypothetical protein